jgi:hypothetical protein
MGGIQMEEAGEEREREGREAGHYIMCEFNDKPCE